MNKIAFLLFMIFITNASAQTDYACVNQCTAQGFQYGLCVEKCSYGDNGNDLNKFTVKPPDIKQTDHACMSDCRDKGYKRGLCAKQCSF